MKYCYFHINKEEPDYNLFKKDIESTEESHVFVDKNIGFEGYASIVNFLADLTDKNNIYVYASSEVEINLLALNGLKFHILIRNDLNLEIGCKIIENNKDKEVFIEIDESSDVKKIVAMTKQLNTNICFVITDIFNNKGNYITRYNKLITINSLWKNPIHNLDSILPFSTPEHNIALLYNGSTVVEKNLVQGFYGDICIDKNQIEDLKIKARKNILTNKECLGCSYIDNCFDRGVGYIMEHIDIKNCLGIKIMENHK